ncbi:MAG: pseudouridine synthase [Eubacteriales bacterium]|nr:pseudouridine synthase [Eubacteriales bacterium]
MKQKAIRLDKYLADAGIGSRSEARIMIIRGLVTVQEMTVKDPAKKVVPTDVIHCDGQPVVYYEQKYLMLHKPQGYISATEGDRYHPCVLELLPEVLRKNLFPVGRLDQDTTGLLLLTTDGKWAHRLLSPKKTVGKLYHFILDRPFLPEWITSLEAGVDIGDEEPTLPCQLELQTENSGQIRITEGRYHQVKRMFAAFGCEVVGLHRLSVGGLELGDLAEGEYRWLSEEEVEALRRA